MQLLAHYAGFTLARCAGHVATSHELQVVGKSVLFDAWICANPSLQVNSFHNWAVLWEDASARDKEGPTPTDSFEPIFVAGEPTKKVCVCLYRIRRNCQ
jgi:hypothetical protein